MFRIEKRIELSASHSLELDYESKCKNLHGHNWIITIYCENPALDSNGMVIDFTKIKELVHELDHKNLNEELDFNPTAENLAYYFWNKLNNCYKVKVQESEGNTATYEMT